MGYYEPFHVIQINNLSIALTLKKKCFITDQQLLLLLRIMQRCLITNHILQVGGVIFWSVTTISLKYRV